MDAHLDLYLFVCSSISLSVHLISCFSSDCWNRQHKSTLQECSTIYHEIGKPRTCPAVSAWFENVQHLAVAYLEFISAADYIWNLDFFLFRDHFYPHLQKANFWGNAVPENISAMKMLEFSFGSWIILDQLYSLQLGLLKCQC